MPEKEIHKEYVTKTDVLSVLASFLPQETDKGETLLLAVWRKVKELPASDVRQVVYAEWIYEEADVGSNTGGIATIHYYRCSNCDEVNEWSPPYCPNCNADMRKGEINDSSHAQK